MDDAVQALNMAFAVIVFVFAISISMVLIGQVKTTSEALVSYSDLTAFYDNIQLEDDNGVTETERIVGLETIIPTLYRYYKENFCVKIYVADNVNDTDPELLQLFDVNIETNLRSAIVNTKANGSKDNQELIQDEAYKKIYNDYDKAYCLFGAPWLGSTETLKQRVDFFVNGTAGYINNTYVDYSSFDILDGRNFNELGSNTKVKERFISYSYSGSTVTTDEGETLVNGSKSKDKIVIIYTILKDTIS